MSVYLVPCSPGSSSDRETCPGSLDVEELARMLEATGDFRVMRRLQPSAPAPAMKSPSTRTAVFVDVETTGLDASSDEIIEVALLPFAYDTNGRIVAHGAPFSGFREPRRPVPPAIVDLTGIDNEMVRGTTIPPEALAPYLDDASLVVAHNASFDRHFLEQAFPAFRELPWACSIADVPWRAEGIRRTGLEALATAFGFFFGAHRAVDDCCAAVEILGRTLPRSGRTVMDVLLESARKPSFRVWAAGAPFSARAALKGRGYRWHDGSRGGLRSWYRDVPIEGVGAERSFLDEIVFGRPTDATVVRLDAYDRYSERALRVPHAA